MDNFYFTLGYEEQLYDGSSLIIESETGDFVTFVENNTANAIGSSTLVMAKDNKIVFGYQGMMSDNSRNSLIPSGSGSVSLLDGKCSATIANILNTATEREYFK